MSSLENGMRGFIAVANNTMAHMGFLTGVFYQRDFPWAPSMGPYLLERGSELCVGPYFEGGL